MYSKHGMYCKIKSLAGNHAENAHTLTVHTIHTIEHINLAAFHSFF